jgi:hypothetical protein
LNEQGQVIGYLAEEENKISSMITRQLLRTHRPFKATVFDTTGNAVLEIDRPAYMISTSLYVHLPTPEGTPVEILGEGKVIGGDNQCIGYDQDV